MEINTLLITEEYIKQYSTVGDNTDSQYITPAIMDAQLRGLQTIIGTPLYDKLCQLVNDNTISDEDNVAYKTLLDNYIAPYLLPKVQANLQINLWSKQRNAGIVNYYDQNQTQVGISEVKFLRQEFENQATFYGNRLLDFLYANSDTYPEFFACNCCNGEMPHDTKNNYKCGINLHGYINKQRKDK